MVPVPVGDGVNVGVCVNVPVCDAVVDCDGESPAVSDRVSVGEIVPVIVGEAVRVDDCVGVVDGVQRKRNQRFRSFVSSFVASVLFAASSTLSVWLIARVLHVFAIPAAVHAAGAVHCSRIGEADVCVRCSCVGGGGGCSGACSSREQSSAELRHGKHWHARKSASSGLGL